MQKQLKDIDDFPQTNFLEFSTNKNNINDPLLSTTTSMTITTTTIATTTLENIDTEIINSTESNQETTTLENRESNCINDNIDINELEKFINVDLNKNIKELGKSIQNDEETKKLKTQSEDAFNKIQEAGKKIENIEIDINNVEIFIEEIGTNLVNVANALRDWKKELDPFWQSLIIIYLDFNGFDKLVHGSELQGIFFNKIKEIIFNFKNNEKDFFKKNIQDLGATIIQIGENIAESDKTKELRKNIIKIGEDFIKNNNLNNKKILENIGIKIEHIGNLFNDLSEKANQGNETIKQLGFVIKNIGFFITKFIKNNTCENYNSSEISKRDLSQWDNDLTNLVNNKKGLSPISNTTNHVIIGNV